jgi:hypothetical protein
MFAQIGGTLVTFGGEVASPGASALTNMLAVNDVLPVITSVTGPAVGGAGTVLTVTTYVQLAVSSACLHGLR